MLPANGPHDQILPPKHSLPTACGDSKRTAPRVRNGWLSSGLPD